ncbi:MAG TPA: universal stress protein [Polyangiaceae bacterium]
MLSIKRILVPTDFNETSDRALDYAVDLAAKFKAAVSVLHAYQVPVYSFPDGAIITSAEIAARLSDAAQKALDRTVAKHQHPGLEISGILTTGVAWEEVCRVATELKADLIVMGTHGRRGLQRALLGSVAENVIRACAVPILIIHGPRDA